MTMIRRDWNEIANAVAEAGFALCELKDADVPEDLERIARESGSEEVAKEIRSFGSNPFGIFVVARKQSRFW